MKIHRNEMNVDCKRVLRGSPHHFDRAVSKRRVSLLEEAHMSALTIQQMSGGGGTEVESKICMAIPQPGIVNRVFLFLLSGCAQYGFVVRMIGKRK